MTDKFIEPVARMLHHYQSHLKNLVQNLEVYSINV